MADVIQDVARELNRVKTVGEARAAAGAALRYVGGQTYPALELVDNGTLAKSLRRQLDAARVGVETAYARLPSVSNWNVDDATWKPTRTAIERLYIEAAGVHGAAGYKPTAPFSAYFADSTKAVTKVVGETVASVANVAGQAAGGLTGGLLGGLGLQGIVLIAAGVFVYMRFFRKGMPL